MITQDDWDLIKGALTDVAQYDDEDGEAAKDLLARIESGDAQAPIKPDIGPLQDNSASIVALFEHLARAARSMSVDELIYSVRAGAGGVRYQEPWHYAVAKDFLLNNKSIGVDTSTFVKIGTP